MSKTDEEIKAEVEEMLKKCRGPEVMARALKLAQDNENTDDSLHD